MRVLHIITTKITVFGGDQVRPNIHIDDITDVYLHLIDHPEVTGIYNAGFENISILDIAKKVTKYIPVEIVITESNDPRSYRQDSSKLLSTGYQQTKTVANAIDEIAASLESGQIEDNDRWYTVKWMTANNIGDTK
jgi:nucleoside-diphosphate-sugar epimerase